MSQCDEFKTSYKPKPMVRYCSCRRPYVGDGDIYCWVCSKPIKKAEPNEISPLLKAGRPAGRTT